MGILAAIADLTLVISVLVPILGGFWAFQRLRRPEVAARRDRPSALVLAALLGVGLGLVGASIGAAFTSFFGGQPDPSFAIVVGLAVAALTFLGSLTGYALLARPSVGSIALAGVLLGPIIVAGPIVARVNSQGDSDRAQVAADVAEAEARGRIFTLTVQAVRTTMDEEGKLRFVDVDAIVRTSAAFEIGPSDIWPSFVVVGVNDNLILAQANSSASVPETLLAGTDLPVNLRFFASRLSVGSWRMRALFMGPGGQYAVTAPLTIPAPSF